MATKVEVSIGSLLYEGRALYEQHDPVEAHEAFRDWVDHVADWLDAKYGDPALSARWSSLPSSRLVTEDGYHGDHLSWTAFRGAVRVRLKWMATALGQTDVNRQAGRETSRSRKVFIVHGHDDGARETVARFLERVGFEAIILHEQANKGRTIIEKVVAHGDVGFAVVLLTPDDEGCKKGETIRPRARQNVVLELGYFIGRLGREHVCALKRGDVELPSDFGGVVYEPFDDSGGWRQALGRELQAAGFEIDWNLAMRP
jgi:predicted nucleotide-binding protein